MIGDTSTGSNRHAPESLIYMEKEAEKGQRVSLLLDNGVGSLADRGSQTMRFERVDQRGGDRGPPFSSRRAMRWS